MNKVISALILYFFYSCGLLSESNKVIVYESSNFENLKTSQKPDYRNLDPWAVHPNKTVEQLIDFENNQSKLPVDVFFIYRFSS